MKVVCVFIMLMSLTLIPLANAKNAVSIQLVRSGDGAVVDTAYLGYDHQFQVMIENDVNIRAMSLGFLIYSEDGITWSWMPQPNGYNDPGTQSVTAIPESRLDPAPGTGSFDMTGLLVTETDVDGISPDTMHFGGVSLGSYLPTGPLEPMIAMHFKPQLPTGENGTICIDSTFVPPSGAWSFVDHKGKSPIIPSFDGPFCWPVKEYVPLLGDFDLDGQITVSDPVEMIKYIFHGKPHFAPVETGDVNCDGYLNVGDVIFLVDYIFRFGPAPDCD